MMLCAVVLLAAASCSDSAAADDGAAAGTVKSVIAVKTGAGEWAEELEPDVLSRNVRSIEYISPAVALSTVNVIGSRREYEPILPGIAGFGSLDLSSVPPAVLAAARGFAQDFCGGADCDSYFVRDCLFSLFFFEDELASGYELVFGRQVPPFLPEQEGTRFSSFLLGNPFEERDGYKLSVRFFDGADFFDAELILVPAGQDFRIEQIFLLGMTGGTDG